MLLSNLIGMLSREILFIHAGKSLLRDLGFSDFTSRMLMENSNTNQIILRVKVLRLIRITTLRLNPSLLLERPQNILDSALSNSKRQQFILLLLHNSLLPLENSMTNGFLVFLSVSTMELTILKLQLTSSHSSLNRIMRPNTMDQLRRLLYSKLMRKCLMETGNHLKIGKKLKNSVNSLLLKKQANTL
jgi:hypothetical protein